MRTKHALRLAAVSAMVVSACAPPSPRLSYVNVPYSVGGNGGEFFSLTCAFGEVIVGIVGDSHDYVDYIQPQCAPFLPDGSVGPIDSVSGPGQVGGSGGTHFSIVCGPGQVAVGFSGRAHVYVDAISLNCAPALGWIAGTPAYNSTDTFGGVGGEQFQALCTSGDLLVGVVGRAGSYIDAAAPVCLAAN